MYWTLAYTIKFLIILIFGLDVEGLENIPHEGGAVVAGNHTTLFDPFPIAVALKRQIHFMAKQELFEMPIISWILPRVNVFPVKRGLADREAIRTAQERVKAGNLLGIFPEGTRNKSDDEVLPLQGGAALIALKTGVPIIPCVVTNVSPLRFRKRVKVTFGPQIDLGGPRRANKESIEEANHLLSSQFSSLIKKE